MDYDYGYNYNYNSENAKDRLIKRLQRENNLGFTFNSILMAIIILGFAFSVIRITTLNQKIAIKDNKINQYQMYIDDVINTDEFKAVEKCREGVGEVWMAECIACELELRNAK